jgi:hypothetical protein
MTKRQMKARREALREFLAEMYGDDTVLLDGPEFDGGLVGVTTDGRLVYSYDKLAEALCEANRWSREDAIDWIEFNTICSLPYVGPRAPVVMGGLDPDEFLPAGRKRKTTH